MTSEFSQRRTVEFHETDMAGIAHFANYFRWMESAEHAFFSSLGLALHRDEGEGMFGWARVHAECDYHSPLRYPEEFDVHLRVCKKTDKALGYEVRFLALPVQDASEPRLVAQGKLEVVHVTRGPGEERMGAASMPEDVARLVTLVPPANHES